ncbi:hypothetical protein [Portibacter lacus]|uniref:Uncharacterized protein n=1 Tax=Portibacter lacus TaxID=1099794 RepID=A0AA37WEH6_9BACT|nr:hypothetical protein [Portibacter lacus]GLR18776.1 hypothetical protein GCM10007940_33920 [Portibacter lacus]
MRSFLLISLISICATLGYAQKSNVVSVIVNQSANSPYETQLVKLIMTSLNESKTTKFQEYQFNEANGKVTFLGTKEEFSTHALLLNPEFNNSLTPEIQYTSDTTGKVKSALMNVNLDFTCNYKYLELGTGIVDIAKEAKMDPSKLSTKPEVINIEIGKYIKGKLPKKDTKAFKELEEKIHNAYKSQVAKHYTDRVKSDYSVISEIRSTIFANSDPKPFEVTAEDAGKKKISTFSFNAGSNQDIAKREAINVFKKVQIGDFEGFERIGTALTKEVGPDQSTAKFLISGGKGLKEAIDEKATIYAVRNETLLNKELKNKEKQFRVSLEKECVFCNFDIQTQLADLYFINFIDKSDEFISKHFIEKYKGEKFIDDKVEDVLGLKEGIDHIISLTEQQIQVTSTETGQVVAKDKKDIDNDYRKLFLEVFTPQMKYLGIAKQKKDRVKRIYVYSPYGFITRDPINIQSVKYEEISGKKFERKTDLGTAQFINSHSELIGEIVLMKNEKDISKAILNNETLHFTYN